MKVARYLILMALGLLAACDGKVDAVRYRLTVMVQTPEGVRTGSGVIETGVQKLAVGTGFEGIDFPLKGEAVAVDLPDSRVLVALLAGAQNPYAGTKDYFRDVFANAMRHGAASTPPLPRQFGGWETAEAHAALRGIRPRLTLPVEDYPLLVTFGDPADPRTVRRVAPDDFTSAFGPGYALRSITLTVTDEPVSRVLVKRLPWVPEANKRVNADAGLGAGDFQPLFTAD